MKKLLLLTSLALVPLMIFAGGTSIRVNGLTFDELDNSTFGQGTCRFTVDYDYYSYTGNLVVPSTVSYGGKTYTVKWIGANCLYNSSVTSIYIPSSVTYLQTDAFSMCSTLSAVICNCDNPPTLDGGASSVFRALPNLNCLLVVPRGTESSYVSRGRGN